MTHKEMVAMAETVQSAANSAKRAYKDGNSALAEAYLAGIISLSRDVIVGGIPAGIIPTVRLETPIEYAHWETGGSVTPEQNEARTFGSSTVA